MQPEKKDTQELVDAVIPLAEELLVQQGEFLPFGFAMTPEGKIVSISADNGDEYPSTFDLISLLQDAYKTSAKKKEFKATALTYDVKIHPENGETSHAVAIDLDHEAGYSVTALLPYVVKGKNVTFGEMSAQAGKGIIFPKLA